MVSLAAAARVDRWLEGRPVPLEGRPLPLEGRPLPLEGRPLPGRVPARRRVLLAARPGVSRLAGGGAEWFWPRRVCHEVSGASGAGRWPGRTELPRSGRCDSGTAGELEMVFTRKRFVGCFFVACAMS